MDMEPHEQRRQHGFPSDDPLQALKADHDFVRKLFDRYLQTQDIKVKQEAGPRILQLLEMHTSLEESVFYPRVRGVDAPLIDHCEDEHQQAKQMMEQIKGMNPGDAQCDRMFRQLADAIIRHVDSEEQQLFPKVRQAGLDLSAIGLEMQAFEANMVSAQAKQSEQRAR